MLPAVEFQSNAKYLLHVIRYLMYNTNAEAPARYFRVGGGSTDRMAVFYKRGTNASIKEEDG